MAQVHMWGFLKWKLHDEYTLIYSILLSCTVLLPMLRHEAIQRPIRLRHSRRSDQWNFAYFSFPFFQSSQNFNISSAKMYRLWRGLNPWPWAPQANVLPLYYRLWRVFLDSILLCMSIIRKISKLDKFMSWVQAQDEPCFRNLSSVSHFNFGNLLNNNLQFWLHTGSNLGSFTP